MEADSTFVYRLAYYLNELALPMLLVALAVIVCHSCAIVLGKAVTGYGMVIDRCYRPPFRITHLLLLTVATSVVFALFHWDGIRSVAVVVLVCGWICYWAMSREDRKLKHYRARGRAR